MGVAIWVRRILAAGTVAGIGLALGGCGGTSAVADGVSQEPGAAEAVQSVAAAAAEVIPPPEPLGSDEADTGTATADELGGPGEAARPRRSRVRVPAQATRGRCVVPLRGPRLDPWLARNFHRYAQVPVAGGGRIPIVVQKGVTVAQVRHVRDVLSSYLRPIRGAEYGSPAVKRRVARAIARSGATMFLFADERSAERAGMPPGERILGQPLYGSEIVLPGPRFRGGLAPDRDATYEEVLHFVQDFGIFTALKPFQRSLDRLAADAVARGVYAPPADVAAHERESIDNEYLAFGLETLYGLWAKDPNPEEYRFSTPAEMRRGDPRLVRLTGTFLPTTRREATRPLACRG
jgi:hypothetical protein